MTPTKQKPFWAVSQWEHTAPAKRQLEVAKEKRQMTLKWSKIKQTVDFSTTTREAGSFVLWENVSLELYIHIYKSSFESKANIFSETNWKSVPATDPH